MSLARSRRLAHDEALMALDYALVAAQQTAHNITVAMHDEPHDLHANLRAIRAQLAEVERSLREIDDYASEARL